MLWTPTKGIIRRQHNFGTVGTTTLGNAVTTGGAAGTKGTPSELVSSTSFDAYLVYVTASGYAATNTQSAACLDIMIGGSGTEEVVIENLLMGNAGGNPATTGAGPKHWMFPYYIPSGTRISARACGQRTGTAARIGISLYGGSGYPPFHVGSKVVTYGVSSLPDGTTITPGASGTEGSWTQVTASTTLPHFCLVPSFQIRNDASINNRAYFIDIGIGPATETEVWQSSIFYTDTTENMGGPVADPIPFMGDVPSGTRLTMRASNSAGNDAGYSCAIHGVT